MDKPTIEQLVKALQASWSSDTAFDPVDWSSSNPARGQCVVSCLVLQDYLGGDLLRFEVTGEGIDEKHYINMLNDGTLIDTTGQQYRTPVTLKVSHGDLQGYGSYREKCLAGGDTQTRFELLKSRVSAQLDS